MGYLPCVKSTENGGSGGSGSGSGGGGLKLGFRGVEIMNDDPSRADVLHMKVTADAELEKLKQILKLLVTAFVANDILPAAEVKRQRLFGPHPMDGSETVTLKWHLTLINTKHRKAVVGAGDDSDAADSKSAKPDSKSNAAARKPRVKRIPFDAAPILKQFGSSLDFGVEPISHLHLVARGAADSQTGGYKCVHALPI